MSQTPSISIAGAGNVAFHLGKALVNAGIPVQKVFNRTSQKAIELANALGAESVTAIQELHGSDLIICCISDSAISSSISIFSAIAPTIITSGAIDVLSFQHVHPVGVFYPLQTFSKEVSIDFKEIPIFIEGSDKAFTALLYELGKQLSSTVIELAAAKRLELHIAAVFINNFTNHIVDLGQQFLEQQQLSFEWLKPLLRETLSKLDLTPAYDAQTGPARRHDEVTIAQHLKKLDPHKAAIYRLITNSIQQRYPRS